MPKYTQANTRPGYKPVHGKASTYSNWQCRCDECKAAHAANARRLRASRRKQMEAISNG